MRAAPTSTAFLAGCLLLSGGVSAQAAIPDNVTFEDFFEGALTFERPLFFEEIPGKPDHYLILEKTGKAFAAYKADGAWTKSEFLSLEVAGTGTNGSEQGLLGLAFHPDYANNRKFYVNYTATGGSWTRIDEGVADATLLKSSGDSLRNILSVRQPAGNHNGGSVRFGPKDGLLYVGFGDGGGSGDTYDNSRGPDTTLLSKFIRIDVDNPADGKAYGIPADNPNVGKTGLKEEVFARGLRNPWRFTFHPQSGEMWVGDVGQNAYEEITIVKKDEDHGWNLREGLHCYEPGGNCDPEGVTEPIVEVARAQARSITGGEFFTGDPTCAYHGIYIFGDKETGRIWALKNGGTDTQEMLEIGQWDGGTVSAFGKDRLGRIFATNHNDGKVYVLKSPDMVPASSSLRRRGESARPDAALRLARAGKASGFEAMDLRGRAFANGPLPTGLVLARETEADGPVFLVPLLR